MMVSDKISAVYARALLELASSESKVVEVEKEIHELLGMLLSDKNIWQFFKSPVVDYKEKKRILENTLKSKVSETVYNFLGVLAARRRFESFPEIVDAFSVLANDVLGRVNVEVRVAVKIDDGQVNSLKAELEKYLKKDVVMNYAVDESLIGGVVIRSGDLMVDTSIKNHLNKMRNVLLETKILGGEYYEN